MLRGACLLLTMWSIIGFIEIRVKGVTVSTPSANPRTDVRDRTGGAARPAAAAPRTPSGGPRRTRLSRAQRAEQIRAAALELALAEGLPNLTHRSLAAHLAVTHGLIAHYEPDIDALRAHAYTALIDAEFEAAAAPALAAPTATAGLAILIDRMSVSGREAHAALWLDGWTMGRADATMAASVRTAMDAWQDMVESLLTRGRDAGEFAVVDPAGAAWEFIALLDGLNAHLLVAYPGPGTYRERIATAFEHRLHLAPGTLGSPPPEQARARPAPAAPQPAGAPETGQASDTSRAPKSTGAPGCAAPSPAAPTPSRTATEGDADDRA